MFLAALFIVAGSGLTTPSKEIQLVVSKDHVAAFNDLSLGLDTATLRTVTVTLLQETDAVYKIQTHDNRKLDISKSLVDGIIYT